MEHEILFQNPVFNSGLNVTCRNGDKWMKANVGDSLSIKETGKDSVITTGTLIGKALLPAKLIPESLLCYEHDPSCCNLSGLMTKMKRIYKGFTEESLVTVLLFKI